MTEGVEKKRRKPSKPKAKDSKVKKEELKEPEPAKEKPKIRYKYDIYYEPICECKKCRSVHLRCHRTKKKVDDSKETPKILCYLVCPKCGCESYTYVGDQEKKKKRRVNTDEQ